MDRRPDAGDRMRVLIVEDGYQRGALTAVRALHKAGWHVGVASPVKGHAARSRHCSAWHPAPQPSDGLDRFERGINAALTTGYDIVLPAGDAELLTLSSLRGSLGPAVRLPDHEAVVNVLDKGIWEREAAAIGLEVPRRVQAGEGRFPVVVKELLHGAPSGKHTRSEAVVAMDQDELDQALTEIRSNGGTGIAQQHIPGTLIGVIVIVDRAGQVIGRGQQEAFRLWPAEAGVSTYARTVEPETELVDKLGALVHELGWWGPAEAQFIETDSQKVLIDINPRIYGSMALATSAGLDVASMWARLCRGEAPTPARAAPGHRYQWLEGDLRRALFASENGRVRDVGRTVAASLGAHHSLWSIRDPWPATRFAATLTGRALRKGDAWS